MPGPPPRAYGSLGGVRPQAPQQSPPTPRQLSKIIARIFPTDFEIYKNMLRNLSPRHPFAREFTFAAMCASCSSLEEN